MADGRGVNELPVPVVPWSDFLAGFRWGQGEHLSIVGATGSGKTVLQNALLPLRTYVAAIGTKPTSKPDPSLVELLQNGYERVANIPRAPHLHPRVVLWPQYVKREDLDVQREMIGQALDDAFRAGGWTIAVDELGYLCRELKLQPAMLNLWQQGRSLGITVVACTQRPAWVPRDFYGASTHLFVGAVRDPYDRSRIRGMGGVNSAELQRIVSTLPRWHFLYCDARDGRMVVTKVDR